MKRGSVLTHVTDLNDEADKESAPNGEQKGALFFLRNEPIQKFLATLHTS